MRIETWADDSAVRWKLVIFDLDGTLVCPKSGGEFRQTADDWQFIGNRAAQVKALRRRRVHCAIATNQGGVAFGYFDFSAIANAVYAAAARLSIPTEMIAICPSHPKASIPQYRLDSVHRKPGAGMLHHLMTTCRAWYWPGLAVADVLMVGDRPEDEGAAHAAGIDFKWADQFFAMEGVA
jgi:D-glycero-D-manno-heptose 1,7-bisphosphate phosphatase